MDVNDDIGRSSYKPNVLIPSIIIHENYLKKIPGQLFRERRHLADEIGIFLVNH